MTSSAIIDLVIGARPNYIKAAALVHAYRECAAQSPLPFRFRVVETGQHGDAAMSADLARQLGLPPPEICLQASGPTPTTLTASILQAYDSLLQQRPPQAVLVIGDVLSTFACALTAKQNGLPLIHVEAGLRSGDRSMPEELNRIATDHFSDLLFTTTASANHNLLQEGISPDRMHLVGNTVADTLLRHRQHAIMPAFFEETGLRNKNYVLATLHRPSNVDEAATLTRIIAAVGDGLPDVPVVFPVHPRTARQLDARALPQNVLVLPPQPYLQLLYLLQHCHAVVTDSGGLSEEATLLNKPCLVFRTTTERPETLTMGTAELVANEPILFQEQCYRLRTGTWKQGLVPEYWDGQASTRLLTKLARWMQAL